MNAASCLAQPQRSYATSVVVGRNQALKATRVLSTQQLPLSSLQQQQTRSFHHLQNHNTRPFAARLVLQHRTAATSTSKPKISAAHQGPTAALPYGMRRTDYATAPPGPWPLPPPSPPSGNVVSRNAYPLVVMTVLGVAAMIVIDRDDSVQDYWRAVERGHFPEDEEDEDDDDLLDDEDDDEWDDREAKEKRA